MKIPAFSPDESGHYRRHVAPVPPHQRQDAVGGGLLSAGNAQFFGVDAAGDEKGVQPRQIGAVNIGLNGVADDGDAGFVGVQPLDALVENGGIGLAAPENGPAHFLVLRRQRARRHLQNAVL